MSRETLATPVLRVGMPVFVNVLWLGLCASQANSLEGLLSSGRTAIAVVVIIALVIGVVFCAVLTLGALRKSRTAFWVYIVLLTFFVAMDVPSIAHQGIIVIAVNLIAMGLLLTAIVSVATFGSWGVRRSHEPDGVS